MEKHLPMPESSALIKGEIADYHYGEDGILYSYSKSPMRTVENIFRNIELVRQITSNKKVPLLIYLTNSPTPDKETGKFSTLVLPIAYTAMAMVSKPGLSQFIISFLFSLRKPPIPMRSFTDDREAKKWLQQFL